MCNSQRNSKAWGWLSVDVPPMPLSFSQNQQNKLRKPREEHCSIAGVAANGDVPAKEQTAPEVFSMDGSDWVELFVREMLNASNIDDARARASGALEVLEKSVRARAGAEVAQNFHQENMVLKEQLEALIQENNILTQAVAVQHELQKEYENQSKELKHLKQLVSQYQEQLRILEVNNYALTMPLKQALQSSSIPGRFNPDVF
ncbi:uncharacterized protein LOC111284417 [Durio zibethinus]|uniref:Uncharacterized protein LOC111284417 n=1 Tax=Durio zibethinus TaxID=66656 RepID=A0A6P5XKU6_DURZI|nr:uncharacterized protein LOC111284417 [Durio zibethinus]